jgi:hypothetical protein
MAAIAAPRAAARPAAASRRAEGPIVFALAFALYFWAGYTLVVVDGVVASDALDGLARAYMVWHNDPPKLAAIGFVAPPLTTVAYLPFALVKPLATSLVALPLVSALFGALMVVWVNRLLARCSLQGVRRWALLAAFALNPLIVFYAGSGMSNVIVSALLALLLYALVSWLVTSQPRFLVVAALALPLLALLRYSFIAWAGVLALLLVLRLRWRGASYAETEGTLVALLAPLLYALGVWALFNGLIIGDVFGWVDAPAGPGELTLRDALPALIVCVAAVAWLHHALPRGRALVWPLALAALVAAGAWSWDAMQRSEHGERAFVQAVRGGTVAATTDAERAAADYILGHVAGRAAIAADNAHSFGVILLTGRPELFLDRVDDGDGTFAKVIADPAGDVRYLLAAKQPGDLIGMRYPTAAARERAGLVAVYENERYILLRVSA